MPRYTILPLLLVLLAPPGSAQTPPADSLAARLAAATRARFRTADFRGEVERPRLAGDSLMWETGRVWSAGSGASAQRPFVPLADLSLLEVPRGTHAAGGAVVGAAVAGLLGLVVGVRCADSPEPFRCDRGEVATATAVAAAVGAAVGALIGAAIPRWETLYRRE